MDKVHKIFRGTLTPASPQKKALIIIVRIIILFPGTVSRIILAKTKHFFVNLLKDVVSNSNLK
jgi:hypothetical protein